MTLIKLTETAFPLKITWSIGSNNGCELIKWSYYLFSAVRFEIFQFQFNKASHFDGRNFRGLIDDAPFLPWANRNLQIRKHLCRSKKKWKMCHSIFVHFFIVILASLPKVAEGSSRNPPNGGNFLWMSKRQFSMFSNWPGLFLNLAMKGFQVVFFHPQTTKKSVEVYFISFSYHFDQINCIHESTPFWIHSSV